MDSLISPIRRLLATVPAHGLFCAEVQLCRRRRRWCLRAHSKRPKQEFANHWRMRLPLLRRTRAAWALAPDLSKPAHPDFAPTRNYEPRESADAVGRVWDKGPSRSQIKRRQGGCGDGKRFRETD